MDDLLASLNKDNDVDNVDHEMKNANNQEYKERSIEEDEDGENIISEYRLSHFILVCWS